jgi:hypothetical protein
MFPECNSNDNDKEDSMGRTCSTHGEGEFILFLLGKTGGKRD